MSLLVPCVLRLYRFGQVDRQVPSLFCVARAWRWIPSTSEKKASFLILSPGSISLKRFLSIFSARLPDLQSSGFTLGDISCRFSYCSCSGDFPLVASTTFSRANSSLNSEHPMAVFPAFRASNNASYTKMYCSCGGRIKDMLDNVSSWTFQKRFSSSTCNCKLLSTTKDDCSNRNTLRKCWRSP